MVFLRCSKNPLEIPAFGLKIANLKAVPILFKVLPQNFLGSVVLLRLEPSVQRENRQFVYTRDFKQDAASGPDVSTTAARDACAYFQVGTVLLTSRGGLPVEKIEVGDVVFQPDGLWHRVAWVCQTQQEVVGRSPSKSADDATGLPKTRFPGVRFKRGHVATRLYQVIFVPVEKSTAQRSFEVSPEFKPAPDSVGKVIEKSPADRQAGRTPSFISVRATPKSPMEIA